MIPTLKKAPPKYHRFNSNSPAPINIIKIINSKINLFFIFLSFLPHKKNKQQIFISQMYDIKINTPNVFTIILKIKKLPYEDSLVF